MENRKTRRKTWPITIFPTTNLTGWTDPEMNQDLHEVGSRRLTTWDMARIYTELNLNYTAYEVPVPATQ